MKNAYHKGDHVIFVHCPEYHTVVQSRKFISQWEITLDFHFIWKRVAFKISNSINLFASDTGHF